MKEERGMGGCLPLIGCGKDDITDRINGANVVHRYFNRQCTQK